MLLLVERPEAVVPYSSIVNPSAVKVQDVPSKKAGMQQIDTAQDGRGIKVDGRRLFKCHFDKKKLSMGLK